MGDLGSQEQGQKDRRDRPLGGQAGWRPPAHRRGRSQNNRAKRWCVSAGEPEARALTQRSKTGRRTRVPRAPGQRSRTVRPNRSRVAHVAQPRPLVARRRRRGRDFPCRRRPANSVASHPPHGSASSASGVARHSRAVFGIAGEVVPGRCRSQPRLSRPVLIDWGQDELIEHTHLTV